VQGHQRHQHRHRKSADRPLPPLPLGARPLRQTLPRAVEKLKPDPNKLGGWYWESGFDRDPIKEMEYVRDWNFRAMYGAWDALKNVDKVLPNHRLNWSAYILGKRESRRLMGDVVLSLDDLKADRKFPDACVPTGWSNDIHHADPRTTRASRATPSFPRPPSENSPRTRTNARSGSPTAASTRATSTTSSWPAAASASPTTRSAPCA
jgi:hypothetical protein